LNFIRIEWVPFQKIKARHTTTDSLTRYSYHKYTTANVPYIHVIRDKHGELLLHKGIEAYNKLKSNHPIKSIPVYILETDCISELEWTYQLFQSCMEEKVNYELKYEYIMLLLRETKNDVESICQNTGCTKQVIFQLIFDRTIPEKYQDLAIKHNRIQLVNEIANNPKLQSYRSVLYPAAFQRKERLTIEKLKLFIAYLEAGYDLNVNSILALENFNKIVDYNEALTYYWDHLTFPDTRIMEGVFYYKGDKNSKINVRL
jgi:hypothetical protein